ncbi:hypothetical protein [Paracoccus sp. SSK6]|uniref:hypothetical protein n=1 Tax=Paracoccus sp. SSK6 TaxID=3143131 RepID=UPI00321A4C1D
MKQVFGNSRSSHRHVRVAAWGFAALLICLPVLATSVTDQVSWGVFDFVFAVLLIGGLGLGWELILKMTRSPLWRAILAVALFATVLLIWAELAIGITR